MNKKRKQYNLLKNKIKEKALRNQINQKDREDWKKWEIDEDIDITTLGSAYVISMTCVVLYLSYNGRYLLASFFTSLILLELWLDFLAY